MKNKIYFLALLAILTGCKKENETPQIKSDKTTAVENPVNEDNQEYHDDFPKTGKSIDDFIEGIEFVILDESHGDLNGDGLEDAVIVVRPMDAGTSPRTLLVLLKTDSGYELFAKNDAIMGPEFNEESAKINQEESIVIEKQKLNIELSCMGPCGNTEMEFLYNNGKLSLTQYSTYNMGAGSHLQTEFDGRTKMATVTEINTMKEDMPETTEKHKLDYPDLEFSVFEVDKLNEAILKSANY